MTTPESARSSPTAARPDVDPGCEFLPGDLPPAGLVSTGLTAGPGHSLYAGNADMDVAEVLHQRRARAYLRSLARHAADGLRLLPQPAP